MPPDPVVSSSDADLRAHVERVLASAYELDREIGRGGMGIVYRAKDRRLKRVVAVKLLPPELSFRSEIRSRFLREAETAAQLSHPNIVPIYSVDERDGLVYFVMACIEGDNLAKRMHDRGPLPSDEVRRYMVEVAQALAYAHARGVIHRDIKPDNILLEAESGRAMVTDFGIARAAEGGDSRLTATGMAIGTPAYMSPEQAAGEREIDGRSDLYSLGVVGYHMLAGELPFNAGSTPAMLVKHLSERPRPVQDRRADVPPDLGRAVMMLLEKDPANRFPSASALAIALESGEVPDLPATAGAGTAAGDAMAQSGRASSGTGAVYGGGGMGHSPSGAGVAYGTAGGAGAMTPLPVATSDDVRRWNIPQVQAFRKKLATFIPVSFVILVLSLFDVANFGIVTAIWSIILAIQYAKLWSEGYDWRDVFKQPRDRLFLDVAGETIDDVRGVFDRTKRAEIRERTRRRRLSGATGDHRLFGSDESTPVGALPQPELQALAGVHSETLKQALFNRNEIRRLVQGMPPAERSQVGDVVSSGDALYAKAESFIVMLSDIERNVAPDALDVIQREIAALEAQANPLERVQSEERVHRLAYLKRQRAALKDVVKRRDQVREKLERCRTALESMRYDLVRLKTGAQSQQQFTTIAERALQLAREVDSVVHGADQVRGIVGERGRAR
ncbi:MAG TPA: serine/threonine-protein kinase [Gemmatimonadaceae bacterium]|nr:serine/threonine-protein kinase [Gemmatimonadaceae bacterium]